MKIESVFFDLDGTLLDTAPDLFSAIIHVLTKYGFPLIPYEYFRPSVELGSRGMIDYAFKISHEDPRYQNIVNDFLEYYRSNIADKTVFFEGMENFLSFLEKRHIPWGIVTNKPKWLTDPLIQHFSLKKRCKAIVCGDTLATRKPDPAPLRYACELAGVDPSASIYIGDTLSDMVAAKAANMQAIAVSFGYNQSRRSPTTWPADIIVDSAHDLQNCLDFG